MNIRRLPFFALSVVGLLLHNNNAFATNPLIMDQFTADPTARVFEGKIYVYPSHDIAASRHIGRGGWFNMEDYHVFSSENLTDWTDHGIIVDQTNVSWVNTSSYAMWAPDCIFKNGKYYFVFPAPAKGGRGGGGARRGAADTNAATLTPAGVGTNANTNAVARGGGFGRGGGGGGGGNRIGVAIADKPYGPFTPEPEPMAGVGGIDPGLLMDDDGSVYMFVASPGISEVKLKDNMLEIDGPVQRVANLPTQGLIEGPFPFKRNGIYYLTYPHAANVTERLEYAMSTNAMGPYHVAGVMMDESPDGCWTDHQSVVEYKGQWYLFYHERDLSPDFDKNRSIRAEYMEFNDDGTIKKIVPTYRGVGNVDAKSKIQIDRYSAISDTNNVKVSYLNTNNTFEGWKISLNGKGSWVKFDRVDFGKGGLKSVNARSVSSTGGSVQVHLDKANGPLLGTIQVGKASDWKVVTAKASNIPTGLHDLVFTHDEDNQVDIDWVSFE